MVDPLLPVKLPEGGCLKLAFTADDNPSDEGSVVPTKRISCRSTALTRLKVGLLGRHKLADDELRPLFGKILHAVSFGRQSEDSSPHSSPCS